jgi:hypothetical protein
MGLSDGLRGGGNNNGPFGPCRGGRSSALLKTFCRVALTSALESMKAEPHSGRITPLFEVVICLPRILIFARLSMKTEQSFSISPGTRW